MESQGWSYDLTKQQRDQQRVGLAIRYLGDRDNSATDFDVHMTSPGISNLSQGDSIPDWRAPSQGSLQCEISIPFKSA
jgi:hypothetical protein